MCPVNRLAAAREWNAHTLPSRSIVGMGSVRAIRYRALPLLLRGIVSEGFAVCMLTEPDRLGLTVEEADHGVFPVSNVVVYVLPKDRRTIIEGVKVHIECINITATMVNDNDTAPSSCQCISQDGYANGKDLDPPRAGDVHRMMHLRSAHGPVCFAVAVWLYTLEPQWIGRDIIHRRQVDRSVAIVVQGIQVIQSQGGHIRHDNVIDLRLSVLKLGAYIRREVRILRLDPHIGRYESY